MWSYLSRRFLYMVILLVVISMIAFAIIELPPGDYLDTYLNERENRGTMFDEAQIAALRKQFGLDLPLYQRYLRWVTGIMRGNFGRSFEWNRSVGELIAKRLPWTVMISLLTLGFTYLVAIPVGIYSSLRQYAFSDHFITGISFLGLATPNFLLALVLMFLTFNLFGFNPSGLFSPEYKIAPWSVARFIDLLKHLPIPVIVIGTAGIAGLIRVMRGLMLDELRKHYVITARAKGLPERALLFKYPVRVAINPIVSTIGWNLAAIVSGEAITSIVLDLPTIGNMLYESLLSQDTFFAGTTVLLLSLLTVVGTFLSDLLLMIVDPRIRLDKASAETA